MSRYVRKVKTESGATAVQIVTKQGREVTNIIHLGSTKTDSELKRLLALAYTKLHEGQVSLFPSEIPPTINLLSSHSRYLYNQLLSVYNQLKFSELKDEVFEQLVIARIIEPTSKLDTIRVLSELGLAAPSKDQIYRTLKRIIGGGYRHRLSQYCLQASRPEHLSLLLYDVTTLYFEIQKEDEFRKSGLSKERRLEPQIVVGLLVDRSGFPLEIHEFAGNLGETKTMIPVLTQFCAKHQIDITKITVTADAGMLSAKNLQELEAEGFSFVVGSRLAKTPYTIKEYSKTHPEEEFVDGQIFETTQWFGYKKEDKIERRVIYQYREKRAKLDLSNIEKQIEKAKRVIEGKRPLKKAPFLVVTGSKPTLNQKLVEEHRLRAGIKGYVTNLPTIRDDPRRGVAPEEVIHNYHQLFQVERSFRMSKSDLKARPIFHHKLDSIKAHLTLVFAALAIARYTEARTKISIKRFVRMLRPIHTGVVSIGGQRYVANPTIPDNVQRIVDNLTGGY